MKLLLIKVKIFLLFGAFTLGFCQISDYSSGQIGKVAARLLNLKIPAIDGEFKLVYSPDPENSKGWFINDHCLIQDEEVINLSVSTDMVNWNMIEPCYSTRLSEVDFGIFESPFVYKKDDLYYLFVCFAHQRYYQTFVVVSDDPYHFIEENIITTLFTHAPEIIEVEGQTYISSCGIEDPQLMNFTGLWIAKLSWLNP